MERKPLILNKERNLGDVISDSFLFVKRNYKVVGRLFLILVCPVLIIGIYNIYYIFSEIDFLNPEASDPFGSFGGLNFLLGYGFIMIAFLLYYFVNYSTAICYVDNDNQVPEQHEVTDFMKKNAVKYIVYFVSVVGVVLVLSILIGASVLLSPVLTGFLILGMVIGMFYLFPILSILPLVYMDNDISFGQAVSESFHLVKGNWWSTFGTIFVTSMIGSLASYILIIPIYAIMMVQMFSSIDSGEASTSGFWMGILMVVSMIGSTIVLVYTIAGISTKYYDLKERKGHHSLKDRIDSLGSEPSTMFENDGEF